MYVFTLKLRSVIELISRSLIIFQQKQSLFWYDGKLITGNTITFAINDPGWQYGATIFTTVRVYQKSLTHPLTNWQAHCDRLLNSLQTFGWQMPDWQRLQQGALQLLQFFPVLRIAIFPDGRELITGRAFPPDLPERQQQGITAILASQPQWRRELATHKTGNYLACWLALQQAHQQDTKEAILVDNQGNWLETSTGNLWGWRDGCWYTPTLEQGILAGRVRALIINWLRNSEQNLQENIWDNNFVQSLKAIAYSNSVVEIVPIRAVVKEQHTVNYEHSVQFTEQIRSLFAKLN